uniref:Meiotic drive suppressor wtf35 n=2 Tax=Schizosaccharomyces TaxID=4895 RepID=WTF35_SCHKA|nr:RecName: Full=Meiotic drive suppressor wtf35 [Schizosaccharomyces kambucha]ARQ19056.1 cw26 [Schizosaccharomyces pombe]QBL54521.1 Wtf35 [Schizosaccharomyces kambucha]
MKNNYTSLKSPLDEEDELKTDHEIDLEKGLLPEYNSEEEGALPPYSDISKLAKTVPEDSSTGPTETANPNVERRQGFKDSHPNIYSLLRLLISVLAVSVVFFTAWVCVNPLEKSIFGKVAFSVTIGITCPILFIAIFCFFETWTQAVAQCIKVTAIFLAQCVKACGKGIKHFLKKWENMPMAFSEVFLFNILVGSPRMNLRYIFGDRWGLKCSLAEHITFVVLSILVFIAETVKPGSIRVNLIRKMGYEAKQQVNEYTAVPLREMNPESEA